MDFKKTALLIVDMQNDFIHDKGAVKKASQGMGIPKSSLDQLKIPIPNIKKLAEYFRNNSKEVIYLYIAWEPDYSDVGIPLSKMPAKELGALVRGSWGAQIIEELSPHNSDILVMKKGYGGFFQTPLDRILRNRDIKTLVTCGVLTNFCVETTVREAVAYGYDVVLVNDATASFDAEGHNATLKVIAAGFGEVMSTAEMLERLAT